MIALSLLDGSRTELAGVALFMPLKFSTTDFPKRYHERSTCMMLAKPAPLNNIKPDSQPSPLVAGVVRQLFGIPIHALTMAQTIAHCDQTIRLQRRLMIGVVNAAKVVNMRRTPILGQAVLQSDLVLADGMAIVWASRILRQPLPERVAGIDLFERLLQLANERNYSIYLLGATQDVMDRLLDRITTQYPKLRIAGSRNGYFDGAQAEQIALQIKELHPDMLFLGMTSPKKEIFLAQWAGLLDVAVCHGVGGSFDVLSGQVKRAPAVWQRLGLEWLYRVVQEPRRMWRRYLVTNSIFICLLLREIFHRSPPLAPQVLREVGRK
jgi:N-acetylglucosaminyldiphosphoundecaprenol N-acetyl-beta-D-mannosaminyltransferase